MVGSGRHPFLSAFCTSSFHRHLLRTVVFTSINRPPHPSCFIDLSTSRPLFICLQTKHHVSYLSYSIRPLQKPQDRPRVRPYPMIKQRHTWLGYELTLVAATAVSCLPVPNYRTRLSRLATRFGTFQSRWMGLADRSGRHLRHQLSLLQRRRSCRRQRRSLVPRRNLLSRPLHLLRCPLKRLSLRSQLQRQSQSFRTSWVTCRR